MSDERQTPRPPGSSKPAVQFSLRTLLLLVTAVAVACAAVFQMPGVVAIPLLLFFTAALVPVLVTVIIYGSSYERTFAIGAIFPPALLLSGFTPLGGVFYGFMGRGGDGLGSESIWVRVVIVGIWVASVVMGFLCVATRRLLEDQRR